MNKSLFSFLTTFQLVFLYSKISAYANLAMFSFTSISIAYPNWLKPYVGSYSNGNHILKSLGTKKFKSNKKAFLKVHFPRLKEKNLSLAPSLPITHDM